MIYKHITWIIQNCQRITDQSCFVSECGNLLSAGVDLFLCLKIRKHLNYSLINFCFSNKTEKYNNLEELDAMFLTCLMKLSRRVSKRGPLWHSSTWIHSLYAALRGNPLYLKISVEINNVWLQGYWRAIVHYTIGYLSSTLPFTTAREMKSFLFSWPL